LVFYLFIRNKPVDILQFGVILVVVGFALFLGYKRLTSVKRGEPAEDELSKKVVQKAAALSYYISLYVWVFMIWLKDRVALDTEEVLGSGIMAMAVIFGISWVVINFRGIRKD
jgi:peptidoglycan/LPS O-acetylase OafA/YrhL